MSEIKFKRCPICGIPVGASVTDRESYYIILGEYGKACISVRCDTCGLYLFEHTDGKAMSYEKTLAKLADRWNSILRRGEMSKNERKIT